MKTPSIRALAARALIRRKSPGPSPERRRGKAGAVVKEPSKVLMLVTPGGRDQTAKIEALREAYKARFRQESVLLITQPVCTAF